MKMLFGKSHGAWFTLLGGLALTACQPAEESLDRRDEVSVDASTPSGDATPGNVPSTDELSDQLADAGLKITLTKPEISLRLREGANIVSWEAIEGAARYDIFFAPLDGNLEQAIRIEGVVSPYTHIKDTNVNLIYTVVAFDESLTGGSEPAAFTSDVPQGYLAKCLGYTDTARVTMDRILANAAKNDCYILSEEIDTVSALDLSGAGIVDLSPLVDFVNLESLNLSNNDIVDLESLAALSLLTELDLSENPNLTNISALSALTGLQVLDLGDTQVSDITLVQELVELRDIGLSNLPLSSLGSLADLRQLSDVDISGVTVPRTEASCPSVSVPASLSEFCLEGVAITYAEQIRRMMDLHCVSCHNVNNAARANLDSEAEVIANARASMMRINNGTMPPGGPLSPSDMQIFASWAASVLPGEAGAP